MRHLLPTILLTLGAAPAYASPYDVYGAGARGAAMGSAQTATATGAEALYFNASQLAAAKTGLSLGVMATFGRPQILLKERPDGYEVPDIGPPSRALGDDLIVRDREDTETQKPLAGLTIGVVAPLVFKGLQAGVLVFLPLPEPVTLSTRFADERERAFSNRLEFERLGAAPHRLDLEFGLAYEVTTWLAAGVGAAYLPGFAVNTGVYLADTTDQADADLNAVIDTENNFGLLAGLTVKLPADVVVGLSFRDSIALRVTTSNDLQLNGITDGEVIEQQANWTPLYTPARGAIGVAWSPDKWSFSGDLRYTFWSTYEDSQGDRPGFTNVFSGSLGTEYRTSEVTALRAGAGFEPSPVPTQDGRTNYVDNHRANFSFGAGHTLQAGETVLDIGWYVRIQGLIRRETSKAQLDNYPVCGEGVQTLCDEIPDDLVDPQTGRPFPEARGLQTGNPGFPGWVSGGWTGSLGVELRY